MKDMTNVKIIIGGSIFVIVGGLIFLLKAVEKKGHLHALEMLIKYFPDEMSTIYDKLCEKVDKLEEL